MRTVRALSHLIPSAGSNRDTKCMTSFEHLIPDTWYLISIGNAEQQQITTTDDIGSILSVNPKMYTSVYVWHTKQYTAAQAPDILRVLAVEASSLQPSITSTKQLDAFFNRTSRISQGLPGAKDDILKRVRISHFFSNKYFASGYIFVFSSLQIRE